MYPSRIEELVGELKRAYPHLPDYIPAELEEEHLATLEPWLERVRYFWGETAEEEDPVLALANEHRTLDKGQMGPVLCALDEYPMTPEARRAWNEPFVMTGALMGHEGRAHGAVRGRVTQPLRRVTQPLRRVTQPLREVLLRAYAIPTA